MTITLNDITFDLAPPKSYSAAFDVAVATGKNPRRGMFAALGLCWNGPKPLRSKFSDSFDALQYGGEVFDELIRAGFDAGEIAGAAALALGVVVEVLPSAKEVDAGEAFIEEPED